MRSSMLFSVLAVGLSALSGCYNPSIQSGGYKCDAASGNVCPDGYTCVSGLCISGAGDATGSASESVTIPKTGSYTGTKLDAQLTSETDCTDSLLEPNDSTKSATDTTTDPGYKIVPDQVTPRLVKLAICPNGPNPKANGGHDVDYYMVDTNGTNAVALVAEVFYSIEYGDIDIEIQDDKGTVLNADGTAAENGCAATPVSPGKYYVIVAGANNVDVNRYELLLRTYSTAHNCADDAANGGDLAGTATDMGSCTQTNGACAANSDCCSSVCDTFGTHTCF